MITRHLTFLFFAIASTLFYSQSAKNKIIWLGTQNRILNPGAEANAYGCPLHWKSDYAIGAESNWVSEYGITSHEWNHGTQKLGLPAQPGNNSHCSSTAMAL